jgi:hypothetical protein
MRLGLHLHLHLHLHLRVLVLVQAALPPAPWLTPARPPNPPY